MKKHLQILFAVIFCLVFSKMSYSQSEGDMQSWMEYMAPGAIHQMLAEIAGNWTAHTTMWMSPDAEPVKSEGSVSAEMIMGGRYLMMKHTGTMFGMPFEGMSIEGFDNATKKFNSVWVDNFGTGMMTSTGTLSDDGKTISYVGYMVDPATGGNLTVRQIVHMNDDGSMNFEMYMPHEGTEYKSMEIQFVREG